MSWRDRLPKVPLDPTEVLKAEGVGPAFHWIDYFGRTQAELPEPYAVVEVLNQPMANVACEALRAVHRSPRMVSKARVERGAGRLWSIPPVLHRISEMTYPGTAIDLGCGAGRDAVWLAANGWQVTAIDRLATNIESLQKLQSIYAPNARIRGIVANLHDERVSGLYNLVLLHYCWDPVYFEVAKRAVAHGGYLSILGHSHRHRECFGYPRTSKILHSDNLNLEGFELVLNDQYWSRDRHSVSIVLRRN